MGFSIRGRCSTHLRLPWQHARTLLDFSQVYRNGQAGGHLIALLALAGIMNQLTTIDYGVFLVYFIVVAAYGYWIYQKKRRTEASTTDFFLAEGSLTWWAIGASLIASNISSEQFIA